MTTFVIILLVIIGTAWAIKGINEHIEDRVRDRVDDELDQRERMKLETDEERMDRIMEMDREMAALRPNPLVKKAEEEIAKMRAKSVN